LGRDGRGVVVELAPGDAHDAVALRDEIAVAGAVLLERPRGVARLAAYPPAPQTAAAPERNASEAQVPHPELVEPDVVGELVAHRLRHLRA
jgi:hypothetical protein